MALSERFLGRYALIRQIGRGGMADVWIGKSFGADGFEKVLAIKVLSPEKVSLEDNQRALKDEARIHVSLKHPNIVDIYDFNFEAKNPYIVVEYVEGIELRDLLRELKSKQKVLPIPIACFIVLELSEALKHAHERCGEDGKPLGIVHRDVSPSNVLISQEGQVKLSDFGIAKSVLQSDATRAGYVKGKFRYMSPEQARGKPLDSRSDVFSLGLVFFELLCGQPAYDDLEEVKIFEMARKGIVVLPESLDSGFKEIFQKLLAINPSQRYPNLEHFQKKVRQYLTLNRLEANRENLKFYLKELQLEPMKESQAQKIAVENWRPVASSKILDKTGIATMDQLSPDKKKTWKWMVGGFIGLAILTATVIGLTKRQAPVSSVSAVTEPAEIKPVKGSLEIISSPSEAAVKIQYGDMSVSKTTPASLTDLPFEVPISMVVSKKGYKPQEKKLTLHAASPSQKIETTLSEIKDVEVYFNADPFAEASIPGIFSGEETPFNKKLAPQKYTVTFTHPPSGKQASATFDGTQGGTISCSANMNVEEPSAQATASCRRK